MAGYTSTGFDRKRFPEILADKNEAQKTVFGPDINLAPESPDGQISGLLALSDDQLWQIAEYAVNATDPDNATGATLSNLVKINFIERLAEAPTRVVLFSAGTPGVTIPANQLVGEEGGSLIAITVNSFTFSETGTAEVVAVLTTSGPIEVASGVLRDIKTPQAGWFSVDNPSGGITGRNRETDAELRLRRVRSVGTNSQNMIDSLIGKLGNLPGVTHANVIQNRTDEVDENGLTPHSFEAIVAGGDNTEIAQTIWETFPFGIGMQGGTSGTAIDGQLSLQVVPFTRPVQVPIYVEIQVKKRPGYPANGATVMKTATVDYANGILVEGRGFFVGDSVIYTELYTPINTVPAQEILSLRIGRNPLALAESNVPISMREYSYFDVGNITVLEV